MSFVGGRQGRAPCIDRHPPAADVYRATLDRSSLEKQLPTILVANIVRQEPIQPATSTHSSSPGTAMPFIPPGHTPGSGHRRASSYPTVSNETDDGDDTLSWITSRRLVEQEVRVDRRLVCRGPCSATAASNSDPRLRSIFHVKAPLNYYDDSNQMSSNAAMDMAPITLFSSRRRGTRPDTTRFTARALGEAFEHGAQVAPPAAVQDGTESALRDRRHRGLADRHDGARRIRTSSSTSVKLWQPLSSTSTGARDVAGMYITRVVRHVPHRPNFAEALMEHESKAPSHLLIGPSDAHGLPAASRRRRGTSARTPPSSLAPLTTRSSFAGSTGALRRWPILPASPPVRIFVIAAVGAKAP